MLNKLLPLFSKKSGFYSSNDFSARLLDNASMTEILLHRPLTPLELIDVQFKELKSADFHNTFTGNENAVLMVSKNQLTALVMPLRV